MSEKSGDSENETHWEAERVGSSKKTSELSQGDAVKVRTGQLVWTVLLNRRSITCSVHVHVLQCACSSVLPSLN